MLKKIRSKGSKSLLASSKTFVLAICLYLGFVPFMTKAQTYAPRSYWTFDYPGNPLKDSMNLFNIDPNFYGSGYAINTNASNTGDRKYMTLNAASTYIRGGQVPTDSAFTIEFLFRPGYSMNTTKFFYRMDGSFTGRMAYSHIQFVTTIKNSSGSYVTDDFQVELNQVGRKSFGYYMDGNWHHFVFKYNAKTGSKEIWIDGQLPAGFSKTTTTGYFDNGASVNKDLMINTANYYERIYGDYDEFATYSYGLPANMIYKHYTEFQNHQHYSFNYTSTPPPTPASVTAGVDLSEFPPGHPNVTVSAIDQLKTFPVPRYKTGHTLLPNFNWIDPTYMGGRFQSGVSDAQAVTNSVTIQTELAKNYNYMLQVNWTNDQFNNAWITMANANPQWKLSLVTLRAQVNTGAPKLWSQSLANDHYLQNSSGQFIDINGNHTGNKVWRPTAPASDYVSDGQAVRGYLSSALGGLTRDVNFVNEDGEVFPFITNNALAADPVVTAAKNASGYDWETFLASKMKENDTQAYRDQFMSLPRFANAKFSEYRLDGHRTYQFRWEQTRYINTPINGQYYSTADFYVRYPYNWRNWISAWHGWQWIVESRYNELALGDKLYSPFVAAGWDINPENDVRPAQWLGLLKCLGMTGAEFYYAGYFNEQASYMPPNPPPYDPKGYAWQAVTPSYAQGITSRYEDLLRNGSLMTGDVPNDYINPQWNAFNFYTGDMRKLVVIRKHNSMNKYAITGTVQPNSNMTGNAENESVATITLNGQTLKFKVRRQGSTYIYDNTVPSAPVFYQLDGWHEKTHPYYWTKDFNIEAELFDNANSNIFIKTKVPAGTAAGDFTQATSSIGFNSITNADYNFQPRGLTTQTYYLWVHARSKDGSTTGFTALLDGSASNQFSCITDTNWVWYRYNTSNQVVSYSNLSLANHLLSITPSNTKLEIEAISILATSAAVYGTASSPCSSGAIITPNGPTTFCQGGSVLLTANSGSSYYWSTGATSQSITVTASGSYTVTVASSVSAPVSVIVNPLPAATITAGGSLTFCQGGSVTLTSSSGSSYLWTPGNQTSQSIAASSSGSYAVRVTNSNGCSATSSAKTVTVNSLPVVTVSPPGPLSLPQGGSSQLTASNGSSYLWTPGNQTTQTITVNTTANYMVRVTNSNSCSATSAPVVVNVAGSGGGGGVATITPDGPTTFCQGGNVSLTANAGSGYQWSTGQTSQAITVSTSGSYVVTVTSSGSTASSVPTTVTVNPLPTATISANGPTSFCQGDNVTLTSSSGSSYLWTPGNQTTQSVVKNSSGSFTVRVTNSFGCTKISSPVNVTVSSCGACPIPSGLFTTGVPSSSADLNWSALSGVDSLQVKLIDESTNFVYVTGTFSGTYTQITVAVGSNRKYRWLIRAKCGSSFTNWSVRNYFTTLPLRTSDPSGNNSTQTELFLTNDPQYMDDEARIENTMNNDINIFPNPASETTNVFYNAKHEGPINIQLMDFMGKIVFCRSYSLREGENNFPIDLKNFAKGVYMIILKNNGSIESKRIVVN
jgi:hypothetical protein